MQQLQYIFLLFFILLALVIAVQDFKKRLVSLWVLLFYFCNCAVYVYLFQGTYVLISNAVFALLYFTFMFGIIFLFYFLKEKKIPSIINSKIGLADIIILPAIGLTLNTVQLVLFFAIVFLLAVAAAFFWFNKKGHSIPLAGIVCICHVVYLISINIIN